MIQKKPHKKTALLVIDVQDSFKARGEEFWNSRGPAGFEDHLKTLITGFRDSGQPVYYILHTDHDPGFSLESPYFRIMDFLDIKPEEPVIVKRVHNAFTGTHLLQLLIQSGITKLAICGIRTEQCCETTTRIASDLGFDVDFVTEATLTFPLVHPRKNIKMTVEEIQNRTEMVLHNRFAHITTVRETLSGLQGESS